MSINPMSMGISANYSVSGISAGRVQTAPAEQSQTAPAGDSVQLGSGTEELTASPSPAKAGPSASAAASAPAPSGEPTIREEAPQASSASSGSSQVSEDPAGAETWHIAGEGSGTEDTVALVKTVDGGFEKSRIAFGTDAGTPGNYHGKQTREFQLMKEAGLPPVYILHSATSRNAEMIRMIDEIGTITPGKYADITAFAGDPLEDFETMNHVRFVMKDGKIYKNI